MSPDPEFIAGRDLVARAYGFAAEVYAGPGVEPGAGLGHPVAVAELIAAAGFSDEAVAAACLHDVVEDTPTTAADVSGRFGEEIGVYVATLTEDTTIRGYEARKDEHRNRVLGGGSVTASIYLADKLARTRALVESGEEIDPQRLDHYWDTLRLYATRRPELPFLSELAGELPELEPVA
jgi:(p)ppGpp synthase/HD superfamily hydrolase